MMSGAELFARLRRGIPADSGPLLFIALVWLVQSWLLFDYVETFSVNIPYFDEWEMIPVLTGNAKITLRWLWEQHNEHRIPLPRLIYLAVETLGSMDFRAGMFFDAGLLSLLTVGCCFTARRVRGSAAYADAFFPLVLLHNGQAENLTWSFQIVFVLSSALMLLALVLLSGPGKLSFRAALGLGLCTVALPLTGGASLALVPALACCTVLSGFQLYRAQEQKRGLGIMALGALGFVVLALYFVDYHRPAAHPVSPTLEATARSALQFLVLGLGSGTKVYWDLSGYLVSALIFATTCALLFIVVRRPEERARALRFGLFFGGMVCLAGGIGWARAAVYPGGIFASRYTTLAVPLFCAMYLFWCVIKQPAVASFGQTSLFLLAALLVVRNRDDGHAEGHYLRNGRATVLNEIQQGLPSADIAARHCGFLYICGSDVLVQRMRMLRDEQIGEFKTLRD